MADHNDSPSPSPSPSQSHGSDMKAAFLGLIVGAIVIFGILRTIVALTNAKYAHERPAAEATR